jgi:recombination protein RecA
VVLDGGLPVGRFTEIYGDYSTLKSYVALKAVASVQQAGGHCAYVDTEHSYDLAWAQELGVDTDQLIVMRPQTGEDALMVMETLIRAQHDLIVWDSIAATQPKQYAEKRPGEDLQPGGQARMMSAGLRRLNSANSKTAILAINQTRVNVGMTYGSTKDSMPGGKAMPFYASYRMRFTKAGKVTEDTKIWTGEKVETAKAMVLQKIKVTLEKSKLSAPSREVWFNYDLRGGFVDDIGFIVGWLIENGFVETGANGLYKMDDLTVRGRDKFIQAIAEDEEVVKWVKSEMMKDWVVASPGHQETPAKSKGGKSSAKS